MNIVFNEGGGGKKRAGERNFRCYSICGTKAQGKSSLGKEIIKESVEYYGKAWKPLNIQPRIFIHDYSESGAFAHIPSVRGKIAELKAKGLIPKNMRLKHPLEYLRLKYKSGKPLFNKGAIRYVATEPHEMPDMHYYLFKHFNNGIVFLDECNTYFNERPPLWQRKLLINHRNKGLEIIYVWHMLTEVPPFFAKSDLMYKWIIFRTGEGLDNVRDLERYKGKKHKILDAHMKVESLEDTDNIIQPYFEVYY